MKENRIKKILYNLSERVRKVKIFYRVFFPFAILVSISAGFLTFFSYLKYSEQINMNLENQLHLLIQNVSYKVTDTMKYYEDLAVTFYDDKTVLDAVIQNEQLSNHENKEEDNLYIENTQKIENKLYQIKGNHKYLENVQFITNTYQYCMHDESGYQRGAIIRDLKAFKDSDFYKQTKENKGYPMWFEGEEQTSFFYKNRQHFYGLADILTMTVAVYHPQTREFLGILLFNVDLQAFSNALSNLNYEKNGNIYLVGQEKVLLGINLDIESPSFPRDMKLYQDIRESKTPVVKKKIEDKNLIFASEYIANTDITATYIADLDTLEEPLVRIRNLCLKIWLLTVIVSWLIAYIITISISIPIRDLIGTIKSLENGVWSTRYKNKGNDEITILGNQYNKMAEKIEQLVEKVYLSEIKRQKLQLGFKNAQLEALLMQINPHFLYNTLDIIRWEAMYEAKEENSVTEMIEKFSKLCRLTVQTGTDTISLKEGLEHATTYIDVINCRHKDKIELKINSMVEEDKVFIPRYLIQPIMENAVVHAFENKIVDCSIEINSYRDKEDLYIDISDNGDGMTEEDARKLQDTLYQEENPEKSIGLRNVHQRICLYYGEQYGISLSSALGAGTRIRIRLPYRNKSEKMETL